MSEHLFWLSDDPFDRLKPLLPNKGRGVPRVDDRKVISGIIHVIRYGLRWRDAPACYDPTRRSTTASCAGAGPRSSTASSKPWPQKAPPPRRS